MKRTVDNSFTQLDTNLNLDPKVREQAQALHNTIRTVLAESGLIAGSFLQGSFARKTMPKPLKDVDIVCLLPTHAREELRGPEGPARAMESFKDPIAERWPAVQFDVGDKPSGKALRVTVKNVAFDIDLVPAFDQEDGYVLIGDRFERLWEPSNTRIQRKLVSDRNQATGGRFVHQVRQAKQLTKNHDDLEFVCGIVVESLAYATIDRELPDKAAIALLLDHAQAAVNGPVLEPAGDDDVTAKWTIQERQAAVRAFAHAADKAAETLALEGAGDMDAAIDVWHSLFGEPFPPAPSRSPLSALAVFGAGSLTSTGRPSPTQAAQQLVAPGRSWSTSRGGAPATGGPATVFGNLGRWSSR